MQDTNTDDEAAFEIDSGAPSYDRDPFFAGRTDSVKASGKGPDFGDQRMNEFAFSMIQAQAEQSAISAQELNTFKQTIRDLVAEIYAYSEEPETTNDGSSGSGSDLTLKSGTRLPADTAETNTIYLGEQATDDKPAQSCLYICLEAGWTVGNNNWARAKLDDSWTAIT